MVLAVLVLVSSAEALENPENLYTRIWHRSSTGPFSDVTWLLAISLAKLRYLALRVALVRFDALFVNPKCQITQLGKQSNIAYLWCHSKASGAMVRTRVPGSVRTYVQTCVARYCTYVYSSTISYCITLRSKCRYSALGIDK